MVQQKGLDSEKKLDNEIKALDLVEKLKARNGEYIKGSIHSDIGELKKKKEDIKQDVFVLLCISLVCAAAFAVSTFYFHKKYGSINIDDSQPAQWAFFGVALLGAVLLVLCGKWVQVCNKYLLTKEKLGNHIVWKGKIDAGTSNNDYHASIAKYIVSTIPEKRQLYVCMLLLQALPQSTSDKFQQLNGIVSQCQTIQAPQHMGGLKYEINTNKEQVKSSLIKYFNLYDKILNNDHNSKLIEGDMSDSKVAKKVKELVIQQLKDLSLQSSLSTEISDPQAVNNCIGNDDHQSTEYFVY